LGCCGLIDVAGCFGLVDGSVVWLGIIGTGLRVL
jgi:hypothetical protein